MQVTEVGNLMMSEYILNFVVYSEARNQRLLRGFKKSLMLVLNKKPLF